MYLSDEAAFRFIAHRSQNTVLAVKGDIVASLFIEPHSHRDTDRLQEGTTLHP